MTDPRPAPATVWIEVDGRPLEVASGATLLAALRENGVRVPTLCHDDRLEPFGGCRVCLVGRRDGGGGLVAACSTRVTPGMVIDTGSAGVIEARRRQLQLLVLDHRLDCPVCERRGDCRLQDLVTEVGLPDDWPTFARRRVECDIGSPLIALDAERCVLCGRCVRLCDEVQGVAALAFVSRGAGLEVATSGGGPLECELCGQCVDACPVGALLARPFLSEVPGWQRETTVTTCSYCSCGCQLAIESAGGRLVQVRSDPASAPNRGKLCVKGRFGWDVLASPGRLTRPLARRGDRLVEVSWEEALARVATALRTARTAGQAVVGLGSARLTTEDAYLLQRFLRSVVGTPHLDAGPGGGVRALVDGVGFTLGRPRSTATLADLAAAEVVLVLRADPTRTHPLVKTELLAGVRRGSQRLLLAHGLSGDLRPFASAFLATSPGREDVLLWGLMRRLLGQGAAGADALERAGGAAEWRAALEPFSAAVVAAATGVSEADLEAAAGVLAAARSLVVVVATGHGLAGDEAGITRAACELLALLGHDRRPGSGVLVLGEKVNVQGVVDVGLHPLLLPGWRDATSPAERAALAARWGRSVAAGPGWSAREAFGRALRGEVGVLYAVGRDPIDVWPRSARARAAVAACRFVVVQDTFLTETAKLADVVLPVAMLLEREGNVTGADGVSRRLARAVAPPARLPLDGQVIGELARRLGAALPEGDALAREIRETVSSPPALPPAVRLTPPPPPPPPVEHAGFLLDAAPRLFHSGTTTRASRILQDLDPVVAVRLAPEDARRLVVASGEMVRVSAGQQEVLLRAVLDPNVPRGVVQVLWNSSAEGAGVLIEQEGAATTVEVRRSR